MDQNTVQCTLPWSFSLVRYRLLCDYWSTYTLNFFKIYFQTFLCVFVHLKLITFAVIYNRVLTFFLSWNSLIFPWLFQYFCHFSLTFFPRLENANYIYLWLQMRLLFQAKTALRQLKYIKMLCLPPIFTDNEHVFHNVELILNKTMSGNNCF